MTERIFSCGRTCRPFCEECRFGPVLVALGPNLVFSHTRRVSVEYRDRDAFGRCAIALGGTVLGEGDHRLYETHETGYGVTLPDWHYPIVLRSDRSLAYDDYNGSWGNVADLAKLKDRYAIEAARSAAEAQGWYCENDAANNLVIYHPEGGTLTVNAKGVVDLAGFVGSSCTEPGRIIAEALGRTVETQDKPEMHTEFARMTQCE
jgi:hypothetical protein